MHYFTFRILLF